MPVSFTLLMALIVPTPPESIASIGGLKIPALHELGSYHQFRSALASV